MTGELLTQESRQLTGINQFRRYDPASTASTGTTEAITIWDGAAMIPGSDRVVVARSGRLDVFDLTTGGVVLSVELPGPFSGMAMHPEGDRIAVSFSDHPATIYSVPELEPINTIPGDGDAAVVEVRYSADGNSLITQQAVESVVLRDPETFAVRQTLVGARAGVRSWDGLTAFMSGDGRRLLGALDSQPQLWDVETGQLIGGKFPPRHPQPDRRGTRRRPGSRDARRARSHLEHRRGYLAGHACQAAGAQPDKGGAEAARAARRAAPSHLPAVAGVGVFGKFRKISYHSGWYSYICSIM